jgi:uncharacterized protein YcfJ
MSNTLDRLELGVLAGMAESPKTSESLAKGFKKFVSLGKTAALALVAATTMGMGDAKAFDLIQMVSGAMGGGSNVQYQQPQQYPQQQYPNNNGQNETQYTGIAIGGVTGGIVGNQVGKGNGKVVATAMGAIGGALVGKAMQEHMQKEEQIKQQNVQPVYPQQQYPQNVQPVYPQQQYPQNVQVVQYPQQYPQNIQPVYQQPQQYPQNVQVVQYPQNGQNETQYTGTVVGGVAGGVIGNQIGKGNGKTAATAIGAVLGALSGKAIQENMQQNTNGNPYNNGGVQQVQYNQNNSGLYHPQYSNGGGIQIPSHMRDMGLYGGRTVNGASFMVTLADSPGIMALQGRLVGNRSIESEPVVKESLITNTQNVMNAYQVLDQTAQEYVRVISGGTTQGHLNKYSTNIRDQQYNQGYRQELENMKNNYERAFQNFAAERANAARVYDMAALDGYNITQFNGVIGSLIPPQSTKNVETLKNGYNNNYSPNKVAQIDTPMINPTEIARRNGWVRP